MTPRRALSFSLAALAFALPLSIAGTNAALAALTAALLWSLADRGCGTRAALNAAARSPVFLALAVYAAWEAVSALGGLDPAASLRLWPKDAHKLWAYLVVFAALAEAGDALVAPALAAGLGLAAAIGIGQSVLQSNGGIRYGFVRAHAFIHPVSFGEIVGLGLIAAAAFMARPGRKSEEPRRRRFAAAFIALLTIALLLNDTRAVLVALAAAYAAACLAEARWRRRAIAAVLVVVAVMAFWEALPTGRSMRLLLSNDAHTSSQRSRFILWDIAWEAGLEHPVFGVGSGQYHRAFEARHPEPLDGQASWSNAHNLYLHQFAERGVPGLLSVLAALGILAAGAWRAARTRADAWALAAWAATAAFLVMNVTETAWQTEQVATCFLFIWLLGAGPRRARENP